MNSRRTVVALGFLLALLTFITLVRTGPSVGIPRDEAIYFEASRRHGAWLSQLAREPSRALEKKSRDEHFRFNREHPPLMKTLAGASARIFAEGPARWPGQEAHPYSNRPGPIPVMAESAAMRLPAALLAALAVCMLFVTGVRLSERLLSGAQRPLLSLSAGLLAAGGFILLPRVAFHASLHCFDLPIAVATLAVVLAYRRARSSLRWSLICGIGLGLAISIKHNALFVGPLLALHYYTSLWLQRRGGKQVELAQLFPPCLIVPALVAPLVFFASWPWLWNHPIDRLFAYFEFHAQHSYYNMEFLGANYNRPPMPVAYPWLMTWATVPTSILILALAGLWIADGESKQTPPPPAPLGESPLPRLRRALLEAGTPGYEGLLLAIFSLFPLLLISLPSIPIFGGTKHWITAYPFMALAASRAWVWLWSRVKGLPPWAALGPLLGLTLLLGPTAWATAHGHPHNLSQYAPLVGGARGAAQLGLNRGFWGYDALELMEAHGDATGRVFLHDLHPLAELQYRREGRWPKGWKSSSAERAKFGFLFHERHMLSEELRLWPGDRPNRPQDHVLLDDVPLTSWYGR
jgi:hypothetical protein